MGKIYLLDVSVVKSFKIYLQCTKTVKKEVLLN